MSVAGAGGRGKGGMSQTLIGPKALTSAVLSVVLRLRLNRRCRMMIGIFFWGGGPKKINNRLYVRTVELLCAEKLFL